MKSDDYVIHFKIDESISPGMFKKSKIYPGQYLANSLTIRALNKDINLEDELLAYEDNCQCLCGQKLSTLFWSLCPYCGNNLKKSEKLCL